MNELQNADQSQAVTSWLDPKQLVSRVKRLQDIMKTVMCKDAHYGVIPGCAQNSLYQPGSQLLSMAFGIGHEPTVEEFRSQSETRYRVTDRVFDQKTGMTLGYGIGECSTSEDKYAWRKGKGTEWDNTPEDLRREKYGDSYTTKQVRTNPSDVANTVLKMARKRANVNGTIEVLAASETFTQDIEDLADVMDVGSAQRGKTSTKPNINPEQVKQRAPEAASNTTKQIGLLKTVTNRTGNKNGKQWQAWDVIIEDTKYSTFSETVGSKAIGLKGQTVEFQAKQNGNFWNLESLELANTVQSEQAEDADDFNTHLALLLSDKNVTQEKANQMLDESFECSLNSIPANKQAEILKMFGEM